MRSWVFLSLLTLSIHARADLVFFDLNAAESEIQAAARAANQRGEKLHVIPGLTSAQRKQIETVYEKLDQVSKKRSALSPNHPDYSQINQEFNALTQQRKNLQDSWGLGGGQLKERMKKDVARLERDGVAVSSVLISGHDGNGYFDGANGRVSAAEFREVLGSGPRAMKDVKSVYLLGCYTTTLGSLETHWQPRFGLEPLFVGYDGVGLTKFDPRNIKYIESMLINEKAFLNAQTEEQLKAIAQSIPEIAEGASICTPGGQFFIMKKGGRIIAQDIEAMKKSCGIETQKDSGNGFNQLYRLYDCYREGRKECENPPDKTSAEVGPLIVPTYKNMAGQALRLNLRNFYNEVHDKSYCSELWRRNNMDIPSEDQIQKLLFYNQVKSNVKTLHQEDLKKMDQILSSVGVSQSVSDLPEKSRAEIRNRIATIQAELAKKGSSDEVTRAKDALNQLNSILGKMSQVPADWHGPSSNPSAPLTFSVSSKSLDAVRVSKLKQELENNLSDQMEKIKFQSPTGLRIDQLEQKMMQTRDLNAKAQLAEEIEGLESQLKSDSTYRAKVKAAVEAMARQPEFQSEAGQKAIQAYLKSLLGS